eukprot:Skav210306  [mRNA]  locus=scaffold475:203152:208145:- [translate_table: standard]
MTPGAAKSTHTIGDRGNGSPERRHRGELTEAELAARHPSGDHSRRDVDAMHSSMELAAYLERKLLQRRHQKKSSKGREKQSPNLYAGQMAFDVAELKNGAQKQLESLKKGIEEEAAQVATWSMWFFQCWECDGLIRIDEDERCTIWWVAGTELGSEVQRFFQMKPLREKSAISIQRRDQRDQRHASDVHSQGTEGGRLVPKDPGNLGDSHGMPRYSNSRHGQFHKEPMGVAILSHISRCRQVAARTCQGQCLEGPKRKAGEAVCHGHGQWQGGALAEDGDRIFVRNTDLDYRLVLKFLKESTDVNQSLPPGDALARTPLYAAAQGGHRGVVKVLCDLRADMDKGASRNDASPLFTAAEYGHYEAVA